ncbi:hypothetical protein B7463_g895, partial [Scytalidium lignicola]
MWASSNLRSDAFLLVYDITSTNSLDQLAYFNDLIDIETETRMDAWAAGNKKNDNGNGSTDGWVKPVKIVAGNKCDLQESRQVPAQVGLDWARTRGCGFMETSARNTVNIEETFALIVRRVVEARRAAATLSAGGSEGARGLGSAGSGGRLGTRRAVTAPLSPLPAGGEKMTLGKTIGKGGFWRKLKCW